MTFETGSVEVTEVIKRTANASILLGKDTEDSFKVLKYIPFFNNSAKESFITEFTMLRLLGDHPSLVKLFAPLQIPG